MYGYELEALLAELTQRIELLEQTLNGKDLGETNE